ncbi:MAG: lysoplasmalogenase [Actinomycetes bacterium]
MTLFWVLIVATLVVAALDWWAVANARVPVEYVAKPLTMAVLGAAALAMPDPVSATSRTWFVVAIALSLVGDVFLMLPDSDTNFIAGLGSFLLGHIAYIVGIWQTDQVTTGRVLIGAVLVLVGIASIGWRVVRGAFRHDRMLAAPVALYIGVISVMVASAVGTGRPVLIVGAVLFFVSDACIGWSRFIGEFPGYRMAIITTYHLGQIGLLLGLLTHWTLS